MEKNANANTNTNAVPETSSDQRHGGERSLVVAASSPPRVRNNDSNPTPTGIERLPSSSAEGDACSRRQNVDATMLDVGSGSEAEQGKKRGRGDGGEPQQQVKAAKKKGELTEVPRGEPRCATCNKVFKSWKALFGHLRSHPERTYRGALPPPTAAELDIRRCQQQLASTLLTVAQEVAAVSRRGLDIDLNQPSTGSPEKTGGVGFDLNVEPPPESDGED